MKPAEDFAQGVLPARDLRPYPVGLLFLDGGDIRAQLLLGLRPSRYIRGAKGQGQRNQVAVSLIGEQGQFAV